MRNMKQKSLLVDDIQVKVTIWGVSATGLKTAVIYIIKTPVDTLFSFIYRFL